MFERFTDRARRVVREAQNEARELGHPWIDTGHLLLGLTHDEESVAMQVLTGLSAPASTIRATSLKRMAATADTPILGHIPFLPPAKKVLELALREALQYGHNYIGTEHLLLGIIREGHGIGSDVLAELVHTNPDDLLILVRERVQEFSPPTTHKETRSTSPRTQLVLQLLSTMGFTAEQFDELASVSVERGTGRYHLAETPRKTA